MLTQVADSWSLGCCRGRAAWAARGRLVDLVSAGGFGFKRQRKLLGRGVSTWWHRRGAGPSGDGVGSGTWQRGSSTQEKTDGRRGDPLKADHGARAPPRGGEAARAASYKWLRARVLLRRRLQARNKSDGEEEKGSVTDNDAVHPRDVIMPPQR